VLHLHIEILNVKHVNIFRAYLYAPFIGPPATVVFYFGKLEFIKQQLAIYLEPLQEISLNVKPGHGIVFTSILLFDRPVKNNWIQV
jgi:hypothetical protein